MRSHDSETILEWVEKDDLFIVKSEYHESYVDKEKFFIGVHAIVSNGNISNPPAMLSFVLAQYLDR